MPMSSAAAIISSAGGQSEEHTDLGGGAPSGGFSIRPAVPVGHLPPRSGRGRLPPYLGRDGALLHKAGLVHDRHPAVGARVFGDVGADVVVDGVGVPAGSMTRSRSRTGVLGAGSPIGAG